MDYFNESKEKWQSILGISNVDIPDKLIIDGKLNYPKWTKIVLDRMRNGRIAWMPNLVIGNIDDSLTGYGACFGGPIASQFCHIYCKMGSQKMVQIGTGGGIQPDIELGDVIVSESVLCRDGVNRLYRHAEDTIHFDRDLTGQVIEKLEDAGIPYHLGRTVCIYDILLWEERDFMELSRSGYKGCDMESGAVGSVAKFFGVPAVSFYVCSDNSASGKDLFYKPTDEESKRINDSLLSILDIALNL